MSQLQAKPNRIGLEFSQHLDAKKEQLGDMDWYYLLGCGNGALRECHAQGRGCSGFEVMSLVKVCQEERQKTTLFSTAHRTDWYLQGKRDGENRIKQNPDLCGPAVPGEWVPIAVPIPQEEFAGITPEETSNMVPVDPRKLTLGLVFLGGVYLVYKIARGAPAGPLGISLSLALP